jgi:hypothetical protein
VAMRRAHEGVRSRWYNQGLGIKFSGNCRGSGAATFTQKKVCASVYRIGYGCDRIWPCLVPADKMSRGGSGGSRVSVELLKKKLSFHPRLACTSSSNSKGKVSGMYDFYTPFTLCPGCYKPEAASLLLPNIHCRSFSRGRIRRFR